MPNFTDKSEFEYRSLLTIIALLASFLLKRFAWKEKFYVFFIEKSSWSRRLSNELLMEEIKLVILEEPVFEKRFVIFKCLFGNFDLWESHAKKNGVIF